MQRKWLIAIPLILILLALCACMAGIVVFTIRQVDGFTLYLDGIQPVGTPAETEEAQDFAVGEPAALVVNNPCGRVEVRGVEGERITVTAHKQSWGKDQAAADAALAQIELALTQDGDTLTAGVKDPERICTGRVVRPSQVDFTIDVPAHTRVQITAQSGSIALRGTRLPAELHSGFGDIEVRDLQGSLLAETNNGRLEVFTTDAGKEALSLQTAFGDIHLQDSRAGGLKVATQNGKVALEKVEIAGESSITSKFGDLSWMGGKTRALEMKSENGRVGVQAVKVENDLAVKTDFGDIHLDGVQAEAYQASSLNGKIEIDGAQGQVKAQTDFGDITILHANAVTFDLKSKNGSLSLRGTLGAGPHQASTDFGGIELQFPTGTAFDFDLQTNFGEVKIDTGEDPQDYQIQGKPDEKHWKGQVNGGGARISAASNNGNITIRLEENTSGVKDDGLIGV